MHCGIVGVALKVGLKIICRKRKFSPLLHCICQSLIQPGQKISLFKSLFPDFNGAFLIAAQEVDIAPRRPARRGEGVFLAGGAIHGIGSGKIALVKVSVPGELIQIGSPG